MAFFGIIIASIILALVLLRQWKVNQYKCLEPLPGPKPNFFFGNTQLINGVDDILQTFLDLTRDYGRTIRVWAGPVTATILSSDHKFLETILCSSKNIHKSWQYNFFHNWLGEGLLTSETFRWKKHRKILTPAFHFSILVKFVDAFERPTSILMKKLEKNIGLSSFNIFNLINLYSLDIMCETSMGTRVDAQENENSEYVNAVKEMGRIVMDRAISPMQMNDFLYRFTGNYYTEKKMLKILHGYTISVIKKRRREMEEKIGETMEFCNEKPTFLDILLMSKVDGEPLSDEAIREEVDTFMFEGHDTTAAGISFALYCLACHPDIQDKAIEEQIQIFGENKNPHVQYNDLQNMKYLEMVIREALRLYPSVPVIGRRLVEDMIVNDQLYPKGLDCIIFTYAIQRNPELFPNPDQFIPTRFINMGSENPFANIPFSAGPRNCIGQKFAMLEMKFVISAILRNIVVCPATPNVEPILVAETILRSSNGINISIKARNF